MKKSAFTSDCSSTTSEEGTKLVSHSVLTTMDAVTLISVTLQAPDHYLRTYRPIKHSDGLETAIMGLEFDLTPFSLSGDKNTRKKSGRNKKKRVRDDGFLGDSSRLSISLRCSSSISTVNSDEQTTETHHQKSAEHFSYGMLFGRGGTRQGQGRDSVVNHVLSVAPCRDHKRRPRHPLPGPGSHGRHFKKRLSEKM